MSPWPDKIKVGFHDYVLEEWDTTSAAMATRHGECDKNYKIIKVCRRFGDFKAANTLIHEIMHACAMEYNLRDEDDEERTVGTMSIALCMVWRDNAVLFDWIADTIKAGP
jgi:hypothetical protein